MTENTPKIKEFVSRISNFSTLNGSQKLLLIAYHYLEVNNKDFFSTSILPSLYKLIDLIVPRNFGGEIKKLVTDRKIYKTKDGYRLYRSARELIKKLSEEKGNCGTENIIIFDPLKPFTAYKALQSLFKEAKKRILIYDAYVEDKTLDILSKVSQSISIQILTNNTYGRFVSELKIFKKEFPLTEVRVFNIHDRFFVIDDECYIIGTSLHSVGGNKYTSLIATDSNVGNILISHYEEVWKNQARVFK